MNNKIFENFKIYHYENPQVFEYFSRFALKAISSGFTKYSSKAIFERIRWFVDIETTGDKFKLNNNYTAYFSRLFHEKYPQYKDFFSIRESQGEFIPQSEFDKILRRI